MSSVLGPPAIEKVKPESPPSTTTDTNAENVSLMAVSIDVEKPICFEPQQSQNALKEITENFLTCFKNCQIDLCIC